MRRVLGAAAIGLLPMVVAALIAIPNVALASAPRLLKDGDSVTASIDAANLRTKNGLAYACYVIDAPSGSAWEIDFKGERRSRIWIGRGKACDAIDSYDLEASGSGGFIGTTAWSRARFVSGGGAYIVIARFADGKEGAYTLDVRKSEGGGRRLKAAPALQQVVHQEAPAATRAASGAVTFTSAAPATSAQATPSAPATTVEAEGQAANAVQASTRVNADLAQPDDTPVSASQILDGVYETPGGSQSVLNQDGDSIWVILPDMRMEARRQADGAFRYVDEKYVDHLRIINTTTLETVAPNGSSLLLRRRNGNSIQAQELDYGYFTNVDTRYGGYVIKLEGNKVIMAMPDFVTEYYRQPDGTFHSYDPNGKAAYGLRIVNMFTVETYNLPKTALSVFVRVNDATPTYIADARRNERLVDARFEEEQAALDAEWEAEQAAIEAERAYEDDYAASTGSTGANILQGFMKGLGEATASNRAMEQSMQDAANRGLAQGAAEYARQQAEIAREEAEQRRADAEYAREVREQEAAERQARLAAERARAAEQARAAEAERARKVQLAARSESDAGSASTATDATMCVQGPVVGPNPAIKGTTLATVINGCPTAIDVRICLMGEGGWDCGTSYGVEPQDKGSYYRSRSSGEIFWDARTSNSDKPLGSPS